MSSKYPILAAASATPVLNDDEIPNTNQVQHVVLTAYQQKIMITRSS
jgi:hypothetical protein